MRLNAQAYVDFIDRLLQGPVSDHGLAEHSGLGLTTVRALRKALHARGRVHRSDWDIDSLGRDNIPVWSWGPGKDAPRFKMTQKQRSQRWARRRRQSTVFQHHA